MSTIKVTKQLKKTEKWHSEILRLIPVITERNIWKSTFDIEVEGDAKMIRFHNLEFKKQEDMKALISVFTRKHWNAANIHWNLETNWGYVKDNHRMFTYFHIKLPKTAFNKIVLKFVIEEEYTLKELLKINLNDYATKLDRKILLKRHVEDQILKRLMELSDFFKDKKVISEESHDKIENIEKDKSYSYSKSINLIKRELEIERSKFIKENKNDLGVSKPQTN